MAEYQFGYTGAQMNTLLSKVSPMETTVNNLTNKIKFFTNQNVAVTAWAADNTYAQYPYRASIALSGVTSSHYPEVIFSLADATSGYFAPVCQSYAGGIYVYASTIPVAAITIPTIKVTSST